MFDVICNITDEAITQLVNSNDQRENVLDNKRVKAFKMRPEAVMQTVGRPRNGLLSNKLYSEIRRIIRRISVAMVM